MKKESLIVTGSRGVIGKSLTKLLKKKYEVLELDLSLGHDLTDEKFVKDWFKKNKAPYLVNLFALNDAVSGDRGKKAQNLFTIELDSFRKYMEVNLTALFSVCREYARNNKTGSIVNFSSIYGFVSPQPRFYGSDQKHIGYSVSKAGVAQLSKHLAVHLAPGIRVNCVVPGGVEAGQSKEFLKLYGDTVPMGRMMKGAELAGILKFLCSKEASYITGSTFFVDGGWTAI